MRRHEKEHSFLELVENEPVSDHEKQVPEVQCAEKVEDKDYEGDNTCAAAFVLIGSTASLLRLCADSP